MTCSLGLTLLCMPRGYSITRDRRERPEHGDRRETATLEEKERNVRKSVQTWFKAVRSPGLRRRSSMQAGATRATASGPVFHGQPFPETGHRKQNP